MVQVAMAHTPERPGCKRGIAPAQSRLVWLAETGKVCQLLRKRGTPAALELAAAVSEAGAQRLRKPGKPAAAFRFYPHPAVATLLGEALEETRWLLWGRAA